MGKFVKVNYTNDHEKGKIEALIEYHSLKEITNLEDTKTEFQKVSEINIGRANEIIVTHIPIDIPDSAIKTSLGEFGEIIGIKTTIKSQWKIANIIYKTPEEAALAGNTWNTYIIRESIRIYHTKSYKEELEKRSKFTAKLTHLKRNTSGLDLINVLKHHKAKTCLIPRNPKTYQRMPYAYVSFSSLEDLEEALTYDIPMTLDNHRIYWVDEDHQSCNRCGHPDHFVKDCPNIQFRKTNEKRITRLANIITKKRLDDPEALKILNKVRTAA